jgi:hypothetical protein
MWLPVLMMLHVANQQAQQALDVATAPLPLPFEPRVVAA